MLLRLTHAIRTFDSEALLWNGFYLNLFIQILVNMPHPGYQALLYCVTLVALYLNVILNNPQGKTSTLNGLLR
jgi:hypothetical protein